MVLEIIGALFLAGYFGSSFYIWVSQIGVILVALALGYGIGGALADRFQQTGFLAAPLAMAGVFTLLIPNITPRPLKAIIMRHPLDQDIPALWQKLDPVLGSTLVFFLPCFVLATLSPYMVRLTAHKLGQVGKTSGLIYAASTVGSIAGVFVSGYVLIDHMNVSNIFRAVGALTVLLGALCWLMDRWLVVALSQSLAESCTD